MDISFNRLNFVLLINQQKKAMSAQQKIEALINKVITAIEAGQNPLFVKPWESKNGYHNPISGNAYTGMNVMFLNFHNYFSNSYENRFATFKQLQDFFKKEKIQFMPRGTSGIPLFFYSLCEKENDNGEKVSFPVLNSFTVFGFNQLTVEAQEILKQKYPVIVNDISIKEKEIEIERILNKYIQTQNIPLHTSDFAAYSPSKDCLYMPNPSDFKAYNLYLSVLAHECAHSTGHETRLNRPMNTNKNTQEYAIEETIAQGTAAYLLAKYGIDNDQTEKNDISYIVSWARAIKDNKNVLLRTFTMIQKVCAFIEGTEKK